MLPARHRMRSSDDFAAAVRQGARAGRRTLVGHLSTPVHADGSATTVPPTLVGFVVSRAIGGAVVRNRVRRRLRHLMRDRVRTFPAGEQLVLRALPPAAGATSSNLADDLDGVLRKLRAKAHRHDETGRRADAAGSTRSVR